MNPLKYAIETLVNAYLKGRKWQMERLDRQLKLDEERNKQLKRIADAQEKIARRTKKL